LVPTPPHLVRCNSARGDALDLRRLIGEAALLDAARVVAGRPGSDWEGWSFRDGPQATFDTYYLVTADIGVQRLPPLARGATVFLPAEQAAEWSVDPMAIESTDSPGPALVGYLPLRTSSAATA
jgi:hypothetical protein